MPISPYPRSFSTGWPEGTGPCAYTGPSRGTPSTSTHPDAARHLPIALPIGALVGDQWVLHGRLDISLEVHRTRGDPVLARCGRIPIDGPDSPGMISLLA